MLKIRKPQNKNNIMVKAVGILTKKSFNNRLKLIGDNSRYMALNWNGKMLQA